MPFIRRWSTRSSTSSSAEANTVRFAAPRIRLISNLTGQVADASEVTRPGYWRRHVREAVRFGDGLHTLATLRPELVIEIGPHPTLLAFASSAFGEATPPLLVPSLRKGRPDWEQMLEGLAAIYVAGAQVDWREVSDGAVAPDRGSTDLSVSAAALLVSCETGGGTAWSGAAASHRPPAPRQPAALRLIRGDL